MSMSRQIPLQEGFRAKMSMNIQIPLQEGKYPARGLQNHLPAGLRVKVTMSIQIPLQEGFCLVLHCWGLDQVTGAGLMSQ